MANVLVVGSGGREHALARKLGQSPKVNRVYCAPGNDGMLDVAEIIPDLKADDFEGLADFVRDKRIDLTAVGPEAPLVKGIADYWWDNGLVQEGHLIFAPNKAAARLEGSKVFAKQFMHEHGIPTAPFVVKESYDDARRTVEDMKSHYFDQGTPVVIKADGLAAGKGSIVCKTLDEAVAALDKIMVKRDFKDAGNKVVIEDFMPGEEASILALSDGITAIDLVSSQDHKPVFDGDKGPNTGGMGAYAPAPVVTPEVLKKVYDRILYPTIDGMRKKRTPFIGCLYVGLMIKDGEPKVVEYNVRFGDPEIQPVLSLLNSDLYTLLRACAVGNLDKHKVKNNPGASCCVVMASENYPGTPKKGDVISGLEEAAKVPGVYVFHAGTKLNKQKEYITDGGRVLGVTGTGANIREAIATAYKGVGCISWEGEQHRNDIGAKAVRR